MHELRFNPLTGEWVIISSTRSSRPVLPEGSCPLCPGVLELEKDYDLAVFDNRYPSLLLNAEEPHTYGSRVLKTEKAIGKCEVIMYTSEHNSAVSKLNLKQLTKLIEVWCDRYRELSNLNGIKYIFIFENRGKEVGATLSHAHGQLYAFPFIPKRIKEKLHTIKTYYLKNLSCALCDLIKENSLEKNIVRETEYMLTVVPPYARFPYEVHIYPKRHVSAIIDLTAREKIDLAVAIGDVAKRYDKLFDEAFPYMMTLYNPPVNTGEIHDDYFHFHVEFNPPKRTKDKLKWMASVETGSWTFINPSEPEEVAKKLREVVIDNG